MSDAFEVLAFEPTGHQRVPTAIEVGDWIEWKQNGTCGTFWLRVEALKHGFDGRAKVLARAVGQKRACWIRRGIFHVVSPEGVDRLSGQRRMPRP